MMSGASAAVCVTIRTLEVQDNTFLTHSEQITRLAHEGSADSSSALRRGFGKHLGILKQFGWKKHQLMSPEGGDTGIRNERIQR